MLSLLEPTGVSHPRGWLVAVRLLLPSVCRCFPFFFLVFVRGLQWAERLGERGGCESGPVVSPATPHWGASSVIDLYQAGFNFIIKSFWPT